MEIVMIAFWFLVAQAMTYALLEVVRSMLVTVAPRVRTPLAALAMQTLVRLALLFATMMIATGATVFLALGGHLATLPSYVGIAFWSACLMFSTLVARRVFSSPQLARSPPLTEDKLISTNPAVLVTGLVASSFATTVVFRNADAIADLGKQNLDSFLGLDIGAIVVTLIVMFPPILVFGFFLHLLALLWLRLKS
jgi:hypothetical protein